MTASFSERAVEAAEEAIDEAVRTWQHGTGRRIRRVAAEAALTAALAVDGLALVPKEPTPDMRIAGGIAWVEALPDSETYVDTADACYKAMLAVAEGRTP